MAEEMADFDRLIDRRDTSSSKWDKYAGTDILPMWVADTDFLVPDFILNAIRARLDHGILGYTITPPALTEAVLDWLRHQFDWQVPAEWLVWLPGVVPGLNLATRASGQPGDALLLNTPIYYPFLALAANAGQTMLDSPLHDSQGRWEFDLDHMGALVDGFHGRTGVYMLCNPQNPTGRIYIEDELLALGQFCCDRDLVLCSDEIHCSLLLDSPQPHIPIAALDPAFARRSITLLAPNKTYNIPGESCGVAIIPDAGLRQRFIGARNGLVPHPTVLALAAATAAYQDRSTWVAQLNQYLAANRDLVAQRLNALPGVRVNQVEATYLSWIDIRPLALSAPLAHFERYGLGLSDGAQFGLPGYVRLNFGCPRARLIEGLQRFESAVRAL